MRSRLYLMRHGAVSYFGPDGGPVGQEDEVGLNDEGCAQTEAARALLEPLPVDRVLVSGLARTVETARIVAPEAEIEEWPDLRELRGAHLSSIPPEQLEAEFVDAFRGVVANDKRFPGGETIGELFDRVLPAVERLLGDASWDIALAVLHGGVNRAILSYALTGEQTYLGRFEQATGCLNVLDVGDEWIVRAVNIAALDLLHASTCATTMEGYWEQFRPYWQGSRTHGSDPLAC